MSLFHNFMRTDRRCRFKFLYNMGWKGFTGFNRFAARKKKGQHFPAFQFISVTDNCNLACQGCWVTQGETTHQLDADAIDRIIIEGKKQGSYFYGILGGEPLLYKGLMDIFRRHSDCYFQLFTNGTLLSENRVNELRQCANVTPLISFEGNELVADVRRGGEKVFDRTLNAIDQATRGRLITGVAVSVCKSNIDMALSDAFISMLHAKGVLYLWFYIYRPAGEQPHYELALSADEILRLRRFIVEGRTKYPIVLIDSYWDADGVPFCPAAEGLSHHINPSGRIEPCPVIQYAAENIAEGDLSTLYENSDFLRSFKSEIVHKTKGCVLMEDPAWLVQFAHQHGATNSSNRSDQDTQLMGAVSISSHGSCEIIPEKNFIYRMAKRRAFFGLGAYG